MEPALRLEAEHGCWARIHWRVELPAGTDLAGLARRMVAAGLEARCDCEMLKVLRTRDGHEIILVPRTGRTQIRVSTRIPEAGREAVARALLERLEACYRELKASP